VKQQQANAVAVELRLVRWRGIISDCFDPYLTELVQQEDKYFSLSLSLSLSPYTCVWNIREVL
jgi:hypothetical protein